MKLLYILICWICILCVAASVAKAQTTTVCFEAGDPKSCAESTGNDEIKGCADSRCVFQRKNNVVVGACDILEGLVLDDEQVVKAEKKIPDGSKGREGLSSAKVVCGTWYTCFCDTKGVAVPPGDVHYKDGCDNDVKLGDYEVDEYFPNTDSEKCPVKKIEPDPVPVPK